MEDYYEKVYWDMELKQFWFKGRHDFIKRYIPDRKVKILDIGCASGGTLKILKNINSKLDLYGIDISAKAIKKAKTRGLKNIKVADAMKLPFKKNTFDIIICSDTLEHVKDDFKVMQEMYRVLKKRGKLILGVPAFKFLWTDFDEVNHHYRRYAKKEIFKLIKTNGFKINIFSYWNFLIFLPALFIRLSKNLKIIKFKKPSIYLPPRWINNLVSWVLKKENSLIERKFRLPFGLSMIFVLEK